jgi:hypothetical protein
MSDIGRQIKSRSASAIILVHDRYSAGPKSQTHHTPVCRAPSQCFDVLNIRREFEARKSVIPSIRSTHEDNTKER